MVCMMDDFVAVDFDFESTDSGSAFDEFIEAIREQVEEEESRITMLDTQRFQQMQFAYAVMKYLTKNSNAVLTYKLYEPYKTMGSISVEACSLSFSDMEWFMRAVEFADNTEVYPLTSGRIRLTLTFHGLTKPM